MYTELLEDLLNLVDDDLIIEYQERAGIFESEAHLQRTEADIFAFLCLLKSHPMALAGVHLLQLKVDGESQTFLATNEAYQRLCATGCQIAEQPFLANVLNDVFGGMAVLGKNIILYEKELHQ